MEKEIISQQFKQLLDRSFREDLADQVDHSSHACFPASTHNKSYIIAKENAIIAGVELAQMAVDLKQLDIVAIPLVKDGDFVSKGTIIQEFSGSSRDLLLLERILLNCMQRMSGIATKTNLYVKAIQGSKAKILDTRKTTPGMRFLEKWAVRIGGGKNHRMGLYDMIMLKDNHIDFCGGISKALQRVENYLKENALHIPVEIEVRSLNELEEVLRYGRIDRIMLDNFTVKLTKEAVDLVGGKIKLESSGGINLDTVKSYAECGVDFISVGELTHKINSVDLSMKSH